ncbi:MAG: MAPEG family protein [Sneathiella sp.]
MRFTSDQRGVLRGMVAAIVATITSLIIAVQADILPHPISNNLSDRLSFGAAWSLAIVLWLVLCIGVLARHRFLNAEDINGSGLTKGSPRAIILQAVLQNTLEQVTLAGFVYGSCAVLLPFLWLPVIPAGAILFSLGRALFFTGYSSGAAARALGFGLTFYPTIVLFGLCIVSVIFDFS